MEHSGVVDAERRAELPPEIGHVVAVRGSNTLMGVEEILGDDVVCVWMVDGVVSRDRFRRETLYNHTVEARREKQALRAMTAAKRSRPEVAPWFWPFKSA